MSEWKKKRTIMRRYDLTAHIYDMRYAEEQAAKIKAALEELTIEKFAWVLDVGCGTGILFDYIAQKAEAVVGLDISKKILLYAKNRAKNFGEVHLILADADNIPIRENVFTQVFGITVLQNMPNPTKTLEEIKRVAKENAVIVVSGLKKSFTKEEFEELLRHASLKPIIFKSEGLKCYVAVCTRIYH
ncbi:MAG: methyltransferase domain-containing protein [Candidatus Bathyarchaeota archaeon]|jgi:ubiquinone/menaquinone biosynthesis C-methylase UbiE|nr:methyltransferase domain-containing protein [Candidatus Bathyarchaeota archaeon]